MASLDSAKPMASPQGEDKAFASGRRPTSYTAFGGKLLLAIFLTHHLLYGFGGGLVDHAMEFTYREAKVDGPRLQVLTAVARLPFSMKALMGLLSDGFPLCGWRKAPYMLLTTLLALAAYVFMMLAAHPSSQSSTGSFFCMFLQMALGDLLVEAKYSERVKAVPEHGPDLLTFVLTFVSCGISGFNFLSNICAGAILQHYGPRMCYWVTLPLSAVILWPASCNHLEEVKTPGARCCSPDVEVWKGNGFIPFMLAFVSGFCAIGMLACSLLSSSAIVNFSVALSLGLLNLTLLSIFLRPVIAKINAFFFLQSAFHVGTHGAAFYFFTDDEEQYPEGPHFSYQFYVTGMGCVAALCSMVGAVSYNRCAKTWQYRSLMTTTSLAYAFANGLSVVAYKRINVKYGISDKPLLLASSAMQTVLGELSWMPMTVMLAQLVPKGLETVMCALLAASLSLGFAVSNYAGALVLIMLGVSPKGAANESAKFDNLWIAALISACGPCVPLILVGVFIPDGRQTDKILDEDSEPGSATTGSLYERFSELRQRKSPVHHLVQECASSAECDEVELKGVGTKAVGKSEDEARLGVM